MDRLTGWGYMDISGKKSFGKFIFKGTEEESEQFDREVIGFSETYYKCIGVKSFKESEYNTTGKLIFTKQNQQQCQQEQTLPQVRSLR